MRKSWDSYTSGGAFCSDLNWTCIYFPLYVRNTAWNCCWTLNLLYCQKYIMTSSVSTFWLELTFWPLPSSRVWCSEKIFNPTYHFKTTISIEQKGFSTSTLEKGWLHLKRRHYLISARQWAKCILHERIRNRWRTHVITLITVAVRHWMWYLVSKTRMHPTSGIYCVILGTFQWLKLLDFSSYH